VIFAALALRAAGLKTAAVAAWLRPRARAGRASSGGYRRRWERSAGTGRRSALGRALVTAPLGAAAAIGTASLMVGAVVAHLRVGIAGVALLPPLAVLAVAGTAAALQLGTM
jgi:hypothetical protein